MNFIGPYGCYEFLNFQRQSNTASLVTISNQVKRQHGRIPTKIQGSAHGRRQMVGGGEVQELSGALETQAFIVYIKSSSKRVFFLCFSHYQVMTQTDMSNRVYD